MVIIIVVIAFGFVKRVFMVIRHIRGEDCASGISGGIGVGRVDGVNADFDCVIGFHRDTRPTHRTSSRVTISKADEVGVSHALRGAGGMRVIMN